ncbi:MAG: CubicO group peptidase (beta-lactamase class C family), partial [Planctomycetota bacterium]
MIALLLPLLFTPANDLGPLVDAAIARWDRPNSPGGAVAVVEGDELVFLKTFGAARLLPQQPITGSTPMYLASLAKSFTAACAVHAARAGKLDLDAPLTATFPELPEAYGASTLRDCLHHRSGVVDVYDLSILADLGREASLSNDAAIELLTRVPQLSTVPGERFLYSNSGYVLLAEAIRRRTGQDLAGYAQEHLFGPLEMKDTRYNAGDPGERAALSYGAGMAGWAARERATNLTGPGGMVASIDDLVTFARAWSAGSWGGEGMHAELLALPPGPHHPRLGGYAAGWMCQRMHGQDVERHFGGAFGFSSDFIHVPALGLTVIALSNAADLDAADVASAVLSK